MSLDISDSEVLSQDEFLENFDIIIENVIDNDEPVRILTDTGYTLLLTSVHEYMSTRHNDEEDE